MKKTITLALAMILCCAVAHGDELLQFSQNSFDGWTYTRDDVELNKDLISHNRVYLYKDVDEDYTLVSPVFSIDGVDGLQVDVVAYSTLWNDPAYNATKGSPTVELLDAEGNVLQSVFYKFATKELERNFSVAFAVNSLSVTDVRLRLACWDANMTCALSARRVFINSVDAPAVEGDVNGDGECTGSDVTALYNFILYNDNSSIVNGDLNNDGDITGSDVTAVYNIILGL